MIGITWRFMHWMRKAIRRHPVVAFALLMASMWVNEQNKARSSK